MNWIKNFNNHIGFLDFSEAERLFELASEASKKGPCLEIGTYCGKSSLVIAEACAANDSYLITVDHHIGSEEHQPGEEYFDNVQKQSWSTHKAGQFLAEGIISSDSMAAHSEEPVCVSVKTKFYPVKGINADNEWRYI